MQLRIAMKSLTRPFSLLLQRRLFATDLVGLKNGAISSPSCLGFIRRSISSSSNDKESAVGVAETNEFDARKVVVQKKKIRNWITYGFDILDQRKDITLLHHQFFIYIVISMWGGIFVFSYYPDMKNLNWAKREARILVRQREVLGLPLIDKNYVDPEDVYLPPDEELDDDDIVV